MKSLIVIAALSWTGLWFTPDQEGQRHYRQGDFGAAAEAFYDPMWKGTALYRDGEFEDAAQAFARRNTAEALYNQGNAWLMHGVYESAISCYDRALKKRPDWPEAKENKALAQARAEVVKAEGGDMGDQTLGADKIVFDKKKNNKGQETQITAEQAAGQQDVQAMWLRRVQTQPADFLKAKFSYQIQMQTPGEGQ